MSEPSAASQIGGFLLALAFIFVIYAGWTFTTRKFHKTPASTRPAAHTSREAGNNRVPYHCATFGHFYVRRYTDRWRCATCGVLSDVVATDDVADIENCANGEAS